MSTKTEREINGPSWTEVILGAALSLALGVVLSALVLVLRPATVVKEPPKEPVANVVYYLEGGRSSAKARQAVEKQKAFLQGGSVVLNEDELNALATPKSGAKKPDQPAKLLTMGTPNFRLHGEQMQISVPVHLSLAGIEQDVLVQARGGFMNRGELFAFVPSELYVGSCALHRVPAASGLLISRFFAAAAIPEDIATAWRKLGNVSVEDGQLHLSVQ